MTFRAHSRTWLLGAALAALAAWPAAAQVKIIMSNDNNAVGVKGQTFEVLKKELDTRLKGKATIELHHSGTLFDQKTQIQGLQLGSVHIIAPTQGIYAPLSAKINALSLPFMLTSPEAVEAAMADPLVRKSIVSELEKKNVTPVAIWINGPRDFSYRSAKPVFLPADVKGMKFRVQGVPVDIKTMQAFGANPIAMSWSEAPTAVQQGVIDAVEVTPNALVGSGIYEMITQVTRVSYQYSFYIVGANKQWWDTLPADVKSGFQEAMKVATKWNWENTKKQNEAAYAKVKSIGKTINTLTPEQREVWVKASAPVWKEFGDKLVGTDVVKRLAEIGKEHP
jgi:C4-dicarboxylate-binding protein DctP